MRAFSVQPPSEPGVPAFRGTRLSSDLCRVRDRVGVDPVMARRADDERLAPHLGHDDGPRGLARSRFPELFEAGDLVNCHRGTGLAQLAFPLTQPHEQLLTGDANRDRGGVGDDRPPVGSCRRTDWIGGPRVLAVQGQLRFARVIRTLRHQLVAINTKVGQIDWLVSRDSAVFTLA